MAWKDAVFNILSCCSEIVDLAFGELVCKIWGSVKLRNVETLHIKYRVE